MWLRNGLTLAIVLISTVVYCQQPPTSAAARGAKRNSQSTPKPKGPTAEEKWLYPAQRVSADVDQYAANLKRDLHAVAFTTLGSYWWKQDRPAAERWVYPAVDEITLAPQEESDADRSVRMEAVRRVLSIVTPLDPMLRERLKDVMTSSTARDSGDRRAEVNRWQAADAIIIAAENGDSRQFANAIAESLEYGVTSLTVQAMFTLYGESPDEANRLFHSALSQASRNGDDLVAFAAILQSPANAGIPSEWKQSVATTFSTALNNPNVDQNSRCAWASQLIQPAQLADAALSQVVTAAMTDCGGVSNDAQTIQRENPQTSDDYLKVAAESKLPSSRYQLKVTAGEKAEEEAAKDDNPGPDDGPAKALRIMDGMTAEERASHASEYKRHRSDVAVRAALWAKRFEGCSGPLRVVDTSPRDTIIHVGVVVAEKMTDRSCYETLMRTTVLRQVDRLPVDDPNDYIRAMNLVLRRGPSAEYSMQTILRAMDRWEEPDPKTARRDAPVMAAPWNKLYPLAIANELFNIPPDTLRAITRGYFRNELLRADFELLLVRGFLDRYAEDLRKEKTEKAVAER